MLIEVKLFSTLRHHVPDSDRHLDGDKWDVPEGATISQVLALLALPEQEAKIFLINGRRASPESILNDGDVLHVFPPMAGG